MENISNAHLLCFYSHFGFIRNIKSEKQEKLFYGSIKKSLTFEKHGIVFKYEKMDWETLFLGNESYKLNLVLYDNINIANIEDAIFSFNLFLKETLHARTVYIEIPSEDVVTIQLLNLCGYRLLETRMTYYMDNLDKYDYPNRFATRSAIAADIVNLKKVASFMRNPYDRLHSDIYIDNDIADKYLSTYIESSVNGFTDYVMVPNEPDVAPDSFLTANYMKESWGDIGINISKMVLSAVSSETNKGWYIKLISEMTFHLKNEGSHVVFMNTQSTNRAVIKVWESLGYKFGMAKHILSKEFI